MLAEDSCQRSPRTTPGSFRPRFSRVGGVLSPQAKSPKSSPKPSAIGGHRSRDSGVCSRGPAFVPYHHHLMDVNGGDGEQGMDIDLNSDLGESFGAYTIGADEELFQIITSANVACGFHGGDPRSIERAILRAKELGVRVGAHPGYPDLVGFGRRVVQSSVEEVRTDTLYQLSAVAGVARANGVRLQHLKAHGALSNVAAHDAATAGAIITAVHAFDPTLIVLANPGALQEAAEAADQPFAVEAFADRTYHANGRLTARSRADALITDPEAAAQRMLNLVQTGTLPTVDGDALSVPVRSICVHSDTPGAVEIMRAVRRTLEGAGVTIAALDA